MTVGLLALCCLCFSLTVRQERGLLLFAGALGMLFLACALFGEARGRLLFAAGNLLLLGAYIWSANERVPVVVVVETDRIGLVAGEGPPLIAAYPFQASSLEARIQAPAASAPSPIEALDQPLRAASLALATNVASALDRLEVRDAAGQLLVGPTTLFEPDQPGAPIVRAGGQGGENAFESGVEAVSVALPRRERLVLSADVLAGGPTVDLWLRGAGPGQSLLVRLSPDYRAMSISQPSADGTLRELAGGYLSLRKPPIAELQTILRDLLRAWLVGLAIVSLGVVMARAMRGVPGPTDWRLPGTTVLAAVLLGLSGVAIAGWIARDILESMPHVQDSVAYLFQARTFALGRLSVPLPPVPEAFEHEFILMRDGQWFSKYPPGHPAILALGVLAGAPWLVSPVASGLTLLLVVLIGRRLYGAGTGLLAAALLLTSPFFLFLSGSMMSHATSLFLATLALWLALVAQDDRRAWPLALLGVTLGWLCASRALAGVAISLPIGVWLVAQRLIRGRSLIALVWLGLGFSWPVIAVLAYNRALTGSPFVNPFELWWSFDRLGFGSDVGLHNGHDLGRGLSNVYVNLDQLQDLMYGWPRYLTLAFVALPFVTGRVRSGDWLCLSIIGCLAGAYVSYWADGVMFGPRYLFEANAALALLTARGVIVAAEASSGTVRTLLRKRE
ncbi:MAG: glycosyltransferase family 39 protein, partial [Chloroflexi bacterium]|nr:glycosyltransferase family 39 protein [Chloroflexota bacterium]